MKHVSGTNTVDNSRRRHDGQFYTDEGSYPNVAATDLADVSVAPGIEIACRLAATPDAPRSARQFVVARLSGLVPADLLEDIAVITSELATNAVYHAGSLFDVLASIGPDGTARIAVSDSVCDRPRMRSAQPTAPDGRGLAIVAALSDRWGVEPSGSGKTVWAELLAR